MTQRCLKHSRDKVAGCNWCGGVICNKCTAQQNGGKWYCEKCVVKLGPVRREQLPFSKQAAVPKMEQKMKIDKDGYVYLGGE